MYEADDDDDEQEEAVALVLALMVVMANSVSCNDVRNINIGHVGLDLQPQDDRCSCTYCW